jgi:hypothetical protein
MVAPSTAQAAAALGGKDMQATQTGFQGWQTSRRAAIAVAILVAAVAITIGSLYVTRGRTATSVNATSAQVQVAGGGADAARSTALGLRHVLAVNSDGGPAQAFVQSAGGAAAATAPSAALGMRHVLDENRDGGSAPAAPTVPAAPRFMTR